MNWGTELWDQYDKVCNHAKHGIDFVDRTSNFIKDRIALELNYAKELRQLVKKYVRKDEIESKYSSIRMLASIVGETNDIAGQRELIAESMKKDVLEPLKQLSREVVNERKKIMSDGADELKKMKNQIQDLERAKKNYDKACEEFEQARNLMEKAENDPNITRAKMDKFQNTTRQKEATMEESKNNYLLTLEATNKVQRDHYEKDMPAIFSRLQNMDINRMKQFSSEIKAFSDCQSRVMPVVTTCLDNMCKGADRVDPEADCQVLVESLKSGFSPPGDLEFREYGRQALKKTAHANLFQGPKGLKTEPKEDFSHLPPAQQKKKLKSKVSELDAAVHKTTSDKNAMEKMISVYTQNPSLGDIKAVQGSLENTLIKMDEQNAELYKFKCYLHKVDGKGEPEMPKFVSSRPPQILTFDQLTKPAPSPQPSPNPQKKIVSKSKLTPQPKPKDTSPPKPTDEFEDDDDEDEEEVDDNEIEGRSLETRRVLYDFEGQNVEEITVKADQYVTVIRNFNDGWLKVQIDDKEGFIPESYTGV